MSSQAPAATEPRWRTWMRRLVVVSAVVGLGVVIQQAVTADENPFPTLTVSAVAFLLQVGAGLAAAQAWVVLLGAQADAPAVRGVMYASQLTKYTPGGGFLQAAGQVTLSTSDQLSMRKSAVTWTAGMILTAAGGLAVASGFAVAGAFSGSIRGILALGVVALVVADRRCLALALRLGRRLSHRVPPVELLPDQRSLIVALVWTIVGFVCLAGSFTVILVDLDSTVQPIDAFPAFIVAWLVGYAAFFAPAGLGAREAVLVVLVPGATTALLLTASLSQRLLAVLAELGLWSCHRLLQRRRGRA